MKLSPTEIFKGKKIFFIGGTGFVGKVTLSMLLHNFPDIGKVYATVRARDANESKIRFWTSIVTSPTFDPLREKYGDGFEEFIKSKVVPVNGDVGNEYLGLDEKEAKKIMRDTDIIINGAGNVTFNPPLESALRTNINGSNNIIKMARMMKKPRLVHVSTCFVAGKRSGPIWENEPVVGYFPRKDELVGTTFDVNREVEDCARLSEQARQEADDAVQHAKFREQARHRFIEEGRDPDDEAELKSAIFRERKMWIRERTTELGSERAEYWGWTNIYTYSKSLAEQIIASQDDIVKVLLRPSIVESSQAYPFPGWNEGFTTTAPLILIALRGQPIIPVNEKLVLDIIPVDMVSGAILAATMNALVDPNPPLVFQASSGDSNPNDMKRIVGLVGLYKRQHYEDKETGNKLVNKLAGMVETQTVTNRTYQLTSAPMLNKLAKQADKMLDKASPRWGGGRIGNIVSDLRKSVESFEQTTKETMDAFAMFKPFMIDNDYLYRSDNLRALHAVIREKEKNLLPWYPERIDWYDYWLNIHFPGMRKWVLPTLEEELKAVEKRSYTYKDLLDLFDTSVKRFPTRVAMRIERNGRKEQYTFEDVSELTMRAAGYLAKNGIKGGDRVILFSNNMPEWGMTYFGILKTGATAIPIDPASSVTEIVTFAKAGEASAVVVSPKLAEEHPEIAEKLKQAGLEVAVWTFDAVFEIQSEIEEANRNALLPPKVHSSAVASLIFTSGTTGTPKAVMLSHKNFVNMISMLSSVLDMDITDGVLSVLPMHHTFEFSAGFLTPFSNGTQITYLNELTAEDLSRTMENGHVTGMVGVPALWEMLHRRIKTRLRERGDWIADLADNVIDFNAWIRDNTPFNLGPIVFFPIHQGLGGKMRYLISGGSALSEKVQKDLHGLGFTVLEGYGLTESSPVLTVARPGNKLLRGSVGKPLPGVEVKIDVPDENGVGEVLARGQNVMLGYYNNDKATDAVLHDRWLKTGDLGKLDEDGNLYIVGRSKDVIIDSNGKNIYPDEIEDHYSKSAFIKEMSVVGLHDDDGGEKIAALVVPDYEFDIALTRSDANKKVEEHFREVSAGLPFAKRVKVLHITPFELPRTATRKVKRPEVVEMIQTLEDRAKSKTKTVVESKGDDNALWIRKIVASVSNRPLSDVVMEDKLADLGFDSLMFVELQAAVEDAGGRVASPDTLSEVQSVRELLTAVQRVDKSKKLADEPRVEEKKDEEEIVIPSIVRRVGNAIVDFAQDTLYEGVLNTRIEGEANVPQHVNFIVAPNHTSHIDTGLVKKALGKDVAEQTVAVAAADYWFDTKYKRAYMNNFTTLVPIERTGSLRQSLRHVTQILNDGYNALIFPEGGRQESGQITEFKPIIGYLSLNQKIGILPIYIWGTYDAFPKGTIIPKGRSIGAKIGAKVGRFLEYDELAKMVEGVPNTEAYRLVAARVQHEIENMRDGTRDKFDVDAIRKSWKAERRKSRKQEPVIDN
ncbi:MAG TPA: AMP-binding protein [Pyrinomonadaceae bacterium]|nr:AMP-binding protein [Chloracidobacterium sp.]MBP9935819.1 AMP-binding protein [Pyrinomonadaceae bacterium]MBK9438334.1 AMP-binding protein [Chloracidobacterium sp.]MBL0240781.1 AMP-binding protein [Chloracidobacterium sp.]HQX54587.1 AMP-binding protein [Pyrinomonadaceae bacterium]